MERGAMIPIPSSMVDSMNPSSVFALALGGLQDAVVTLSNKAAA